MTGPARPAAAQPSQRLKGKARKLAKESGTQTAQKASSNVESTTSSSVRYSIAVKDFLSLAQYIVKTTKPLIEIPSSFTALLDRTILARKNFSAMFPAEDDGKEAGHEYFLGILTKTRELLLPRMTASSPSDLPAEPTVESGDNGKAALTLNLRNTFAALTIEEPSQALIDTPSAPSTKQAASSPATQYQADKLDIDGMAEQVFAAHCLFGDLDRLRRFVSDIWQDYKQDKISLIAAATATNTAYDAAREMEQEFAKGFPKSPQGEQLLHFFYTIQCVFRGQHPNNKQQPSDDINFGTYDLAELLFVPACMMLSSFMPLVKPGQIPAYKPGHFGVYDPKSDRSAKTPREQFLEDKIFLLELLPEFCVLAEGTNKQWLPSTDELTKGLWECFTKRRLSLWVIFATQCLLDIHHILRDDVKRGYNELARDCKSIEVTIKNTFAFHKDLRIVNWPKSNDRGFEIILEQMDDWVKRDCVNEAMQQMGLPNIPAGSFRLLKANPVFCGLLSLNFRLLCHEASIVFVNAWGSVVYSGQLYNAVRQEKLLDKHWQDMDDLIALHGPQDLFVGSAPTAAEDYLKRFTLMMGYSASNHASNRRRNDPAASKAGPRGLQELAPVAHIFKRRYCYATAGTEFSSADVETVLKHSELDSQAADAFKLSKKSALNSWRKEQRLTAIQLLESIRTGLQAEEAALKFDHLGLHRFCWQLLRNLNEDLKDDLLKYYGPGYLESESQLPFVVGYIFMMACETDHLAQGLLKPRKDVTVTSKLLQSAAECVAKTVG